MACIFYNMPYVFFCMVQERKKTGFCGWKNKNKTDRNAIGFYGTPDRTRTYTTEVTRS